jgi:hypothetical protein
VSGDERTVADAADAAVVARWWQAFVAAGDLPADLAPVQTRLVRGVYRGALPSGPVFVKAMAFPRAKDRLRYAFRALPGAHEAAMLQRLAAAGVPAPAVVAVRTRRAGLLPAHSLLVLRALPVVAETAVPAVRIADEAALVLRLLAAGVVHGDLHTGNFVRLADGRLAVLDLQSATPVAPVRADRRALRVRLAANLLQDRPAELAGALRRAGLLRDDGETREALARAGARARAFQRGRVGRCLAESTEFTRAWRGWGCEHRRRDAAAGRWLAVADALAAWRGQRVRELAGAGAGPFLGCRRHWPLLRRGALLVPDDVGEAAAAAAIAAAVAADSRWRARGEVGA